MRTATLIVIIALGFEILASLYWLLIDFKVVDYNETITRIIRPVYLLCNVALLVFFIMLYQKQTKN